MSEQPIRRVAQLGLAQRGTSASVEYGADGTARAEVYAATPPVLAQIMFSRPFADFDPTTEDDKAGVKVRKIFVHRVQIAVDAELLAGDPAEFAYLFFALVEGLAAAESAQRLGASKQSVDRRWRLGVNALIDGLRPGPAAARTATASAHQEE